MKDMIQEHRNKVAYYQKKQERDFMWAMASNLLVGAMLGATLALWWAA